MAQGTVQKISGNMITIDKKTLQYNGKRNFEVRDKVSYKIKKKMFENIKVIKSNKKIPEADIIINKKNEAKSNPAEEIVRFSENKKIKDARATLNKKNISILPPIFLEEFQSVEKIKKLSNYLIREYIEEKYEFYGLNNSQFSSFHDVVANHKYNFESQDIYTFIEDRISRDKGSKFYKCFKENFLDKLEDIYFHQDLQGISPKIINKELFLLLKKYYKYKSAKKIIEEGK